MGRRKHVPQRTCVVCGQKRAKRELLRVVRTPEGTIELDPTGKRPGRGAYLCLRIDCWQSPAAAARLGRALKHRVHVEDMNALRAAAASLVDTPEAGSSEALVRDDVGS